MDKRQPRTDLPPELESALQDLLLKLQVPQVASVLWEYSFTAPEREALGGDFAMSKLTEGYADVRDCSLEEAVVDLAEATDLLSAPQAARLRRQLGKAPEPRSPRQIPRWDASSSKLFWGEEPIRELRKMRHPSRIQRVLEAFQAAGWPSAISRPRDAAPTNSDCHQLVKELNSGLKRIRFHAQAGGGEIRWELQTPVNTQ